MDQVPRLMRIPEVTRVAGRSRSEIYRRISDGLWTSPIILGPRFSAWPTHEIDQIIRAEIAGASRDEVRELVKEMMAQRAQLMPPRIATSRSREVMP